MSAIKKREIIWRENLDEKNYFPSLLAQAAINSLITDTDAARIQTDSVALLARLTNELTAGDSSSIPVEKAQELMKSITYSLGIRLKTFSTPDEALEALCREGITETYEKGQRRIAIMVKTTSLLHERLKRELILTKNECYRATAVEGIDGFFRLYRAKFGAHLIHITADYPTCLGENDLCGIEFIRLYVRNIYLENYFCSRFASGSIHRLLNAFDKNYGELIFNIFTPVLTTAFGCVMAKREVSELLLNDGDVDFLCRKLEGKDKATVRTLLSTATEKLADELSLSPSVKNYILLCLPSITDGIIYAVAHKTEKDVFIVRGYSDDDEVSEVKLKCGRRMNDKTYRNLVEHVDRCTTVTEKCDLITLRVKSFADFSEILADISVSESEMDEILLGTPSVQIAALISKYGLCGDFAPDADDLRDGEKRLCLGLERYLGRLSPNNRTEMLLAASRIKLTK